MVNRLVMAPEQLPKDCCTFERLRRCMRVGHRFDPCQPPPSPLFWRFAETVEKGPLLAGFFVSAQIDPGLRSRKCGDFDPWSLALKFPFLARFRLFEVSCAAP